MGWDNNRVIKMLTGEFRNEEARAPGGRRQTVRGRLRHQDRVRRAVRRGLVESPSTRTTTGRCPTAAAAVPRAAPASTWAAGGLPATRPAATPWGYSAYSGWDDLIYEGMRITDRVKAAEHWQMVNEDYLMHDLPIVGTWISAGVKLKNKRFVMPILEPIPKPQQLSQIKVYPVHIGPRRTTGDSTPSSGIFRSKSSTPRRDTSSFRKLTWTTQSQIGQRQRPTAERVNGCEEHPAAPSAGGSALFE